ncbi:MAG: DUF1592 domain-containing protein [Bdellovibrionales bacterium]|nr:DUF1592 domain-containing protein [Bdellovibrionales bacterium]
MNSRGLKILLLMIGWMVQGCGSGMHTLPTDLSSETGGNPSIPLIPQGKALYEAKCASCHGGIATSNKKERSPHQITQAITTLSAMSHLRFLTNAEVNSIAAALGFDAAKVGQCKGTRTADTTALFRMNKTEYVNTVADLFGSPASVADNFPPDNDGQKFANDAKELASISIDLAEQYLLTAEKVVSTVWTSNKALIMSCDPAQTNPSSCAGSIIDNWGLRILRRPLLATERTQLLAMVTTTTGVGAAEFEGGIQTVIEALLVSPDFLFRVVKSSAGNIRELDNYELATRLSYFLWSSTVDTELLNVAKAGTLKQTSVLRAQIARMLASPKAKRMTAGFASRWFGLKGLSQRAPDPAVYPTFTSSLKNAFEQETVQFWENLVSKDLSLKDILRADYTFVNAELAAHYGLSGVTGTQFRQVSLVNTPRRGIASQGSMLLLTSHGDDSSIVTRGKWVMQNLMCDPPPPPPPNVPVDPAAQVPGLNKRQKIEAHRNNPNCFSCHAKMDPIGFGLENFDGIGGYRLTYNGGPVDNAGQLPNGQPFNSAVQLVSYLDSSGIYNKCVAKNLTTYALGRVLDDQDDCNVEDIVKRGIDTNGGLSSTIEAIVTSDLFSKVKGN